MNDSVLTGWESLRHGGLLLDAQRLRTIAELEPALLAPYQEQNLRRAAATAADAPGPFIAFVLEGICGFRRGVGTWLRGSQLGSEWSRRTPTGETVKPRHVWQGEHGAELPVFVDSAARLGIGRGRRAASEVVQWLRAGGKRLGLLTNGHQWRLVFAGLDFDAWCEWDSDVWFEEGALSAQVQVLRTLFSPRAWTPERDGEPAPLAAAVLDSRKGQAELSAALGERVREAVELLVQAHGDVLRERCADVAPAEIYRAAVRVVMRLVVILFAESRDLLPRDNAVYHASYGLGGLIEELQKAAARGGNRLARSYSAWPRLLALFRLVHQGSHHPALPVPEYGGELFAAAPADGADGLERALRAFETAAFDAGHPVCSDIEVYRVLERVSRTRTKLRQGRGSTWVTTPIDFSDLSSEYIGILYEGLLDFELQTADSADPVIFLNVGNQPALPLSRLEAMDDGALRNLLEKMKDTSKSDDGEEAAEESGEGAEESSNAAANAAELEEEPPDDEAAADETDATEPTDPRLATRTRAETWARRAAQAGGLVSRPRGRLTPERQRALEDAIGRKARQLVVRVVLPGEWYLVRWGGTRKGSGTFYTRPGLAVPTAQRTLRSLAYVPPNKGDGTPDRDAPAGEWAPRTPEGILALKVCDPACGSGTFPVAALRFLTDALYAAVHAHGRVAARADRSLVSLLGPRRDDAPPGEALGEELIPCRPDDPAFEPRLKAVLRRYVVERCIYGVDVDPLAVELCRLSLWIETMDRSLPFSFLDHKIKCGNSLVGAWFDQFRHYPVMAFKNREGGDKNHTNGVHFVKEARTKALKAFAQGPLKQDLKQFLDGPTLFDPRDQAAAAATVHAGALALLARLHDLPVQDAAERARRYREELLAAPAYRELRAAMDLWCACWFWPVDELADAPLPSTLAAPSEATRAIAARLARKLRFFHWELEFPDVFRAAGAGFDAVLGNPPWETLQPNSKEFFSNIDPLYRTYGKQEALRQQAGYFDDEGVERDWLGYNAGFAKYANWMKYVANAYGDPAYNDAPAGRFSVSRRPAEQARLHDRWRRLRATTTGYADPSHPFVHRGEGKAYTYKLFLETAHALLHAGGRMGFIVPSGLYSDHGAGPLRRLFLDRCRWEWLFGFENREGIFAIHRSYKFNPVILEKGGATDAIRTAFMRRRLEDWEHAEALAVPYSRAQVARFSPKSLAILEIQSARDLEILEKIYAHSVLLGDDGPDGWGVKYAQGDFNMTSDSKLFPPRPKWEEKGYRPDEYSRWLLGNWRPIGELWAELGIDPTHVVPAEVQLEDWLFDASAGPERCAAEAQFVHGHLLKPGDVARTEWRVRCAQPPYDRLPIPRADIPEGVILSREGDAWIREDQIEDVALPLYQGVMVRQFDFSAARWISGTGLNAKWDAMSWSNKVIAPQFLMARGDFVAKVSHRTLLVGFRDIARTTDTRTMIACPIGDFPAGNKVPVLLPTRLAASLLTILNSFVFDWALRERQGSTSINYYILAETPLLDPQRRVARALESASARLALASPLFAATRVRYAGLAADRGSWGIATAERVRVRSAADASLIAACGIAGSESSAILNEVDLPKGADGAAAKGFWRVDKDKDPELRHTVLTLVAFHDLEEKIRAAGGDRDAGIEAFLNQNDGEGWMLPETLCLADYGLGHDERAKHPQPVASRLGPRFYDWQLAQGAEESWRGCHLHAQNLLGEAGYRKLLAGIEAERSGAPKPAAPQVAEPAAAAYEPQRRLFD